MGTMATRLVAAGIALAATLLAHPAHALDDSALCGLETVRHEHQQAIPDRLLQAISLVESGRWDAERREVLAWPWTVMAEGEGRFLPSKASAIAEVRKLQARGVKNIDVGCMQINLQAHADAFATLEEAFEPSRNVAYAARFLTGLHETSGDWQTAGAWYHSQTPDIAADYKGKLVATWDKLRSRRDDRLALADSFPRDRPPLGIPLMMAPPPAVLPPLASEAIAHKQEAAVAKVNEERGAARQAADAFRQAQLEAYRQRKASLQAAGGGHPPLPGGRITL